MLGILVAGAVLAFVAVARGPVDADYFWHLRTGRLILESGLPASDPYSFTYDGPWVLHEWLGEVIIAGLVGSLGEAATLVLFGIAAALALAIPALALRDEAGLRARTAPTLIALTLAAVVLVSFVTMRPQVLSWLMLGILLAVLIRLDAERPRRSLVLIPLFTVWANLHGLYVVGLGIVAIYTLVTLAGATRMASARGWMTASAVASLLASMLTPAGPAGLLYPLRYLEPSDWGLANIQEWQSPDFHDPANLGLLVLLVGLVVVAARAHPAWLRLVAAAAAALALLSVRNAPVLAVLALPALALGLNAMLPATRPVRASAQLPRRIMELGVAVFVIAVAGVLLLPRAATWSDTLRRSFPVAGADALERANPAAHVLAEYGWGGYLIGRSWDDGLRVFVDGRNDMYPDQVLADYSSLRAASDGWQELTDAYGVDAILVAPGAPIVEAAASDGWCEAYRDDVQVLLLPACDT
jgi:hypothetical protein